jgi:hypothetical protein
MYAHIRRVNLRIRLCAVKNREIHQARGQLDLNLVLLQVRHLGFRVLVEPHDVGKVKLNFRPRPIRRRHFVARHKGSVHRARHPFSGITAHGGNVAMNHADAPHCRLCLGLRLRLWVIPGPSVGCDK